MRKLGENIKKEEMRRLAWELFDVKERARDHLIVTNSNLVSVLIGITTNGVVVGLIGLVNFFLGESWLLYLGIFLFSIIATIWAARRWIGNHSYFKHVLEYFDEVYPDKKFQAIAYGDDYPKYYEAFKEWRKNKYGR